MKTTGTECRSERAKKNGDMTRPSVMSPFNSNPREQAASPVEIPHLNDSSNPPGVLASDQPTQPILAGTIGIG